MRTSYRFTLLSGGGVCLALGIMAACFYRERMLFSDMAFQVFHIIRTGDLQVQSGRFGAVGTQFFPWVARNLGFGLKQILWTYSVGHVTYYALLFAWIMAVTKQWRWGLALILFMVLMTTHTFYWLSEAPQGLAFLLALLAWLDTRGSWRDIRRWQWPLVLGAFITAFYFHPMLLYALVYSAVWLLLYQQDRPKKHLWVASVLVFVVLFIVKFKILPLDWYDAMSLNRAQAFSDLWPNWFDLPSNRDFFKWVVRDYYLFPLLLMVNLFLLFWQRRWWLAGWSLLFPLAYILVVNVPFYKGDNQFYLENLYLPLAVMVIVPFVFLFDQSRIPLRSVHLLVVGLLLLRLVHIGNASRPWHERLQYLTALVQEHPAPKNILLEQDLPKAVLKFTWGIPYETVLLTSLPGPDSTHLFYVVPERTPKTDSLANRPDLFLGTFKHYPLEGLPGRYFHPSQQVGYK